MKVCRVEEMRELDRTASSKYNISELILMENAGLASVQTFLLSMDIPEKRFAIFCGGDGFVVARKLHSLGGLITVFVLGNRDKYKGAVDVNLQAVLKMDMQIIDLKNAAQTDFCVIGPGLSLQEETRQLV